MAKFYYGDNASSLLTVLNNFVAGAERQAYRQAFLARLEQDIPDMEAVLAAELQRPEPSEEMKRLIGNMQKANITLSSYSPVATLRSEQIQQAFPMQYASLSKAPRWARRHQIAPWAMILSQPEFTTAAGDTAQAAELLAEMVEFLFSNEKTPAFWFEDTLNERTQILIKAVRPEDLANCVSLSRNTQISNKFFTPSIQQQLNELLKSTKDVLDERKAQQKDSPKKEKEKTETTIVEVAFPKESATLSFLSDREKLIRHLKDKPDAEWLNRDVVWNTVRDLAVQASFVERVCSLMKSKGNDAEEKEEHINGLGLLGKLNLGGQKDQRELARQAMRGYLASVQNPADLAAVAVSLVKHAPAKALEGLLIHVNEASTRIGFSLKDAGLLVEDLLLQQNRPKELVQVLGTLYNPTWTAKALDGLLSHKPLPLQPKCLMPLVVTLLGKQEKLLDQMGNEAIVRLTQLWPGDGNYVKEATLETFPNVLADRVQGLPLNDKIAVAKNNLKNRWDSTSTQEGNFLISSKALQDLSPTEYEQAFSDISESTLSAGAVEELLNLVPAEYRSQEATGKILHTLGHKRLFQQSQVIAGLVGYERDKAPYTRAAEVWNTLTEDDKLGWLGALAERILQQELRENVNSEERNSNPKVPVAVLKNMMFDLVERTTPQATVPVKHRDVLVELGVAAPGERVEWNAIVGLMAPFLSQPRPEISWAPAVKSRNVAPFTQQQPTDTATVVTAEMLEQRIGNQRIRMNDYPHPGDVFGRMHGRHGMGMMEGFPPHPAMMFGHPRMIENILEHVMSAGPRMLTETPIALMLSPTHIRTLTALFVAREVMHGELRPSKENTSSPAI